MILRQHIPELGDPHGEELARRVPAARLQACLPQLGGTGHVQGTGPTPFLAVCRIRKDFFSDPDSTFKVIPDLVKFKLFKEDK